MRYVVLLSFILFWGCSSYVAEQEYDDSVEYQKKETVSAQQEYCVQMYGETCCKSCFEKYARYYDCEFCLGDISRERCEGEFGAMACKTCYNKTGHYYDCGLKSQE